jgi:PAS domain-containing protein
MGPNGAISLVLTSLALLALGRDTEKSIARAQLLACGALMLAVVALTGYLYGARELYEVARVTGIALPTPFAFFALALAILTSRTDVAPVAVLVGSRPGSVMARRLLPAALALPLVMGFLRVLGQDAGLYDTGLGTAMFGVALATTFVVLIWRNAGHANALDNERLHALTEKRESERRFRRLADLAPVMIFLTDSAKQCIWVNEPWLKFVGRRLEEELGDGWAEDLHPDDRTRCFDTYRKSFDARKPFERWSTGSAAAMVSTDGCSATGSHRSPAMCSPAISDRASTSPTARTSKHVKRRRAKQLNRRIASKTNSWRLSHTSCGRR